VVTPQASRHREPNEPALDRQLDRVRPGRPNLTSERELQAAALALFRRRGFHAVTVDDLAAAVGISRRTFNRYFASKADVLWHDFDRELENLALALDATSPELPLWTAITEAVVQVSRHRRDDRDDARLRFQLIVTEPQVRAAADQRYDAWEQTITGFVERRFPKADRLTTHTVGRVTLAACRTAFEVWLDTPDQELAFHLRAAIGLLADGFGHLDPARDVAVAAHGESRR
jgi:mycofactocin system transcriptional regulator